MHKHLERTKRVIEKLSDTFNLQSKIEVGEDTDLGETLEIDGWLTVCMEDHPIHTMDGSLSDKKYPHVCIYAASFTPATRWEPEDVDINFVEKTLSPVQAAQHIVDMIIKLISVGVIENLVYDLEAEDDTNEKGA